MNTKPITQHYWNTNIVQPPKPADKPREDRRKQSQAYKKAKKQERAALTFIITGVLILAFVQLGIADGWIHGPVYLADLIR